MRIVMHPATLELGGSQLNAVDIAIGLRQRGHDVRVFGPPGALVDRIEAAGLEFDPAPATRRLRPSPAGMQALRAVVQRHHTQVVHAWEWPPIMDAVYGPGLRDEVAVVGSVMSMGVAPFIPTRLPLTVGTATIAEHERQRRPDVVLLEPPVDTDHDSPVSAGERAELRAQLGIPADQVLLVVVGRLVPELKREGVLDAIRATGALAADGWPVQLVVVGDGPVRAEADVIVAQANARAGRVVTRSVGAVSDPSSYYAAADIVLGMGGSILRGMAFGQPVVVQGERAFWSTLTPETLVTFLRTGWYGLGPGGDGAAVLAAQLMPLLADPARRARLGSFAREIAVQRFSLAAGVDRVERMYAETLVERRRLGAGQLMRSFVDLSAYDLRRRVERRLGRAAADDFNGLAKQPVTVSSGAEHDVPSSVTPAPELVGRPRRKVMQ